MKRLFALVVGIDRYPGSPLQGCVNDAHAWQTYLESPDRDEGEVHLEVLLDEEATRRRIVETFRSHLGRAGEGDTALFCFSGHGSEEMAPPAYAPEEAGGVSETLVAYDSRTNGGLDLADKELAALIAEVARHGAHVAVILDSCHSGTATREHDPEPGEDRMRRRAGRPAPRPPGSYWFESAGDTPAGLGPLGGAGGWRVLPRGRHVLLAACEDHQVAKECTPPGGDEGDKRGLFSYFLLEALKRSPAGWTYREVFQQARARIQAVYSRQNPQAEGDLARRVFDDALPHRVARHHVRVDAEGAWHLDAGSIHGMAPGTELKLLPLGSEEPPDGGASLGRVRVTEAGPAESRVEPIGEIERDPAEKVNFFGAVPTRHPLPGLRVALAPGSDPGGETRRLLATSPRIACAEGGADLVATRHPEGWHLREPEAPGPLVEPGQIGPDPADLVAALERITHWRGLASLANPGSALRQRLDLEIFEWSPPEAPGAPPGLVPLTAEGSTQDLVLPYRTLPDGGAEPRRLAFRLTHRHHQALYFALLALDESFAVQVLPNASGRLPPGGEVWSGWSRGIVASVPDEARDLGVTRRRDHLVLLSTTDPADFTLLTQDGVGNRSRRRRARSGDRARTDTGLVRELMESPTRDLGGGADDLESRWAVERRALIVVRPRAWRELPADGEPVRLAPGLTVTARGGSRGAVRLHGPSGSSGAAARTRRAIVGGALGQDPGLSVLEVRATAANPGACVLDLAADLDLREDESFHAVHRAANGVADEAGSVVGPGRYRLTLPEGSVGPDGTRFDLVVRW